MNVDLKLSVFKPIHATWLVEMSQFRLFPIPIMQYVLGGSLHKINTSYLLLRLHHASVNWISIVLMQIAPQSEMYYAESA